MQHETSQSPSTERAHAPRIAAPGPRSWPLIGDPSGLRGPKYLYQYLDGCWRRYGDTFRVNLAGARMLVVAHPDALKDVLWSKRQNYVKGKAYSGVRRILGNGLLTLEGDAWKGRRQLEQPAFHRRSLEKLAVIMRDRGAVFLDELARHASQRPLTIDAHPYMVRLTLDVVVAALFGQALNVSPLTYQALGEALELVSRATNGVVLPEWVPTPFNLRFHRTVAELNRTVYGFIEHARREKSDDGSLLSMLLAARDEHGAPLSDEAIRDEVITLFIAGHETTALTLTWLLALLDGQPEVIARMRREVDDVLGDRDPGFEDVPKLSYVRKVVDETLRMRPPAPFVARNVVADDELGGYPVRAGEMVLLFFAAAQRHKDFWPSPDAFDPERFDPALDKARNSWSYLPFSGGPRVCIGNMFSIVESVILLAQILRRFDVAVQSCADVRPVTLGTMRPSSSVPVTLTQRSSDTRRASSASSA
jgi:cytochrome P450